MATYLPGIRFWLLGYALAGMASVLEAMRRILLIYLRRWFPT